MIEVKNNQVIHRLFEDQVNKTPYNVAVVCNHVSLTYKELNDRVNQVSFYIKQNFNLKPEELVVLCLERNEHMLIAILSILKAGCAYLPIDSLYPDDRIKYILGNASPKLILTNALHSERLFAINSLNTKQVSIDTLQEQLLLQTIENPVNNAVGSNLAYILYTSGTTGVPKGVMIEHQSVVNYIDNVKYHGLVTENDIVDFSTNIGFDLTVTTTLCALCIGAKVVIYSGELEDLDLYKQHLIKNNINVMKLVPSYFELLIQNLPSTSINKVILGGEKISSNIINKLSKIDVNKDLIIYDEYGPTEATVGTCISKIYPNTVNLTIGKPYNNYQAYVLDSSLTPLPIGTIGELYIGGIGLARGYLNEPELTAEKFITNLFQTKKEKNLCKNGRLYKTGDLVRWLPDGNLEYIGRNDSQIKIRGYRIEIQEIESVLQKHEDLLQAVVVVKSDLMNNKKLVAYVVSGEFMPSEIELKSFLKIKLPSYTIPNNIVFLDKLPLTPNGKLDVNSLPEPISYDSYIPPRNQTEKLICEIWAQIFNLQQVGIRDDFFRLGGDSIINIQLVHRLRQKLNLNISVKDIFDYKNIENIYDNIISKQFDNLVNIQVEEGLFKGNVELLAIQKWFFLNKFAFPNHFNQSFIIKTPQLNINKLKTSIHSLIIKHDAFRLRYKNTHDSELGLQYYDDNYAVEDLKLFDIRTIKSLEHSVEFNNDLQKIFVDWQSNFNIEHGPTYSIGYIYGYSDSSARVYFAMHHLITDSVSWRVLTEDLKDLYYDNDISSKKTSYRQWVNCLINKSKERILERDYWLSILSDYNNQKLNKFILDENVKNRASFSLNRSKTQSLLQDVNLKYNTKIDDILLTSLAYALTEITKDNINHILVESHGREDIDSSVDISRTMGWFTALYPMRLEVASSIDDSIKKTKENLILVPDKGIFYGILVPYQINLLPRVMFNYFGQLNSNQSNLWEIVDSDVSIHPDNYDHNIMNIVCAIIDGQLRFSMVSKLDQSTCNNFITILENKLEGVINHLLKQKRSYLTFSDVNKVISQEYLDNLQEAKEVEAVYLANSLQEGFIYNALISTDDSYIVQTIFTYNSPLDVKQLKASWSLAQKTFSTLRLRFAWANELVQVIDKNSALDWLYIDISNEENQEEKLNDIKQKDRLLRYDLSISPLFRVILVKLKDNLYKFILSHHHSILDGWSNQILLKYVHEVYLKSAINIYVKDFYHLSQQYLQNNYKEHKGFWINYISQITDRCDLKTLLKFDSRNVKISDYKHINKPKKLTLIINDNLYDELRKLSINEQVTINAVLQYIWHKLLHVYSKCDQTVVGITVSGRTMPINGIDEAIGLYINTLPLIVNHKKSLKPIIRFIQEIQDNINEINIRSNVKLAELQFGGERLFDSLFIYENYPNLLQSNQNDELKVDLEDIIERVDYPLSLVIYEKHQHLKVELSYAEEIFCNNKIANLLLLFEDLIKQITSDCYQIEQNLRYLDHLQYQKIIYEWNNTHNSSFVKEVTFDQLFIDYATKNFDKIAAVYGDIQITYQELYDKAHLLASHLIDLPQEAPVVVILDRSIDLLVSMLGIWMAGAVYVPLDPSAPLERNLLIIDDCKTKIIISNLKCQAALELAVKYPILLLDNLVGTPKQTKTINHLKTSLNLAYIIYTSGSTGKPKGVMVHHQGMINHVFCKIHDLQLTSSDVIAQTATQIFDISVWQLITAIVTQSKVVIFSDDEVKNSDKLLKIILKEKITVLELVPAHISALLQSIKNNVKLENIFKIKHILITGEQLSVDICKQILLLNDNIRIVNAYGPTECSDDVTHYTITNQSLTNLLSYYFASVPIGKVLPNLQLYVLDDNLKPVPYGTIGEIYISGIGLARGYFNAPDLTAQSFIANPFATEEDVQNAQNLRLYKTGDLGIYAENGIAEYISRVDTQIKIRGYRVELKEIESVICSYKGIEESIVVINTIKDSKLHQYLIGYYVSNDALDEKDIIRYISSKLPDYMVVNHLVRIEKIPLLINGKVSHKELPIPKLVRNENFIPPLNQLERNLCKIFADILSINESDIGIHDSFFRFGGNSILAIRLINVLNNKLDTDLELSVIFQNNTVNKLLQYLSHHPKKSLINQEIDSSKLKPLSFSQLGLWFIEKYTGGTSAYNIPMLFQLKKKVNIEILINSLKKVILRHEPLRTIIKQDSDSNYYQFICNDSENKLQVEVLNVIDDVHLNQELFKAVNKIYDLTREYPVKLCIYKLDSNLYISIVVHHMAFDGWSIDIFLKELQAYYHAILYNEPLILPNLAIQYKDFAAWQRNYLKSDIANNKLNYWKQKLNDIELLNLIPDKTRPCTFDYQGKELNFTIDYETSVAIRELANKLDVSLYSILLASYSLMLSVYSNQNCIILGTPSANRHYQNVENIIGYFVSLLVIKINIRSEVSIHDFIQEVWREVIESQLHQEVPFEKIVEELGISHDPSRSPLINTIFSVQSFGTAVDIFQERYKNIPNNVTKFDLETIIDDSQLCLNGIFNYSTSIYDEHTILAFIKTYKQILKSIAYLEESNKIQDIDYIDEEEKYTIMNIWNKPVLCNKEDFKAIHCFIEEQATLNPSNIAIIHNNVILTYKELNEKANQLANYIKRSYSTKKNEVIALYLDASEHTIISILAVLKLGLAYVPIDINLPKERIQYILQDTRTRLVLTNSSYYKNLVSIQSLTKELKNCYILTVDSPTLKQEISLLPTENLPLQITSSDLMYVIYTSGTTGTPKGVMLEHASVVNAIISQKQCIESRESLSCGLVLNYAFDASVLAIFLPLMFGHKLVVADNFSKGDISFFIQSYQINNIVLTPSLLSLVSDETECLKNIIIGGEIPDETIIKKFMDLGINVWQHYGLTECSIVSTCKEFVVGSSPQNIGTPIDNALCYVLNANLKLLPSKSIGELYIGGIGLARGYLNASDSTNQPFIVNPFQTDQEKYTNKNDRLYKTNDLASWLPDGSLKFIGRKDSQVKIRGYRVELIGIENVLLSYPEVKSCVVVLINQLSRDVTQMVAYYTADKELDSEDIKKYLISKLPNYMIPEHISWLNELPLTPNGKIDTNTLKQSIPSLNNTNLYVEPTNELENIVCQICSDILKLQNYRVALNDNFFKLGGNSILAMKFINKLNKKFKNNIFTLEGLFHAIDMKAFVGSTNTSIVKDYELLQKDLILDSTIYPIDKSHSNKKSVFLTGATGFLGAYILDNLMKVNSLDKIYCLIRSTSKDEALKKILQNFHKYKLNFLSNKIEVVIGDFTKEYFGLDSKNYYNLAANVDLIIHNGALVNHIYSYNLLREANIISTVNMLNFSKTLKQKDLTYISTLSVSNKDEVLYEKFVNNDNTSSIDLNNGYDTTKFVSEVLLKQAHERGFKVKIFRPGLIFNIQDDLYTFDENNHFYSLLAGCIYMSKYPNLNENLDISSVKFVSDIITQISLTESTDVIFNISNPLKLSLQSIIEELKRSDIKLELCSNFIWNNLVANIDDESNPLFKISSLYVLSQNTRNENNTVVTDNVLKYLKNINKKYPDEIQVNTLVNSIIAQYHKHFRKSHETI